MHGWPPEIRIWILEIFDCLTNIISTFIGFLDVIDEKLSSGLIIRCLLG
jgi:hypothetical protein